MGKKKDKFGPSVKPKEKEEPKELPSVIHIKLNEEEYLEVNIEDYFERINRQGWSCVQVKKY